MLPIFSTYLCLFTSLSQLILLSLSLADSEGIGGGAGASKSSYQLHPDHKFVSGKTVDYLPDPIFYDTYIPILFKIPIPKHTEGALKLIWGKVQNCTKAQDGELCPVAFHLFKVIKKLANDMNFWKPYYVNHTSTKKESAKKRSGYEVICNEISPHFFRSFTNNSMLDKYQVALRACSRIGQHIHVEIPSGNWVVDKSIYYQMMKSFSDEYFSHLPQNGKVDWAVTQNAYTAIHGLLLTNHVMESVRLATAFRICQSGLIPETFVSMGTLKDVLRNNTKYIGRWNYQLVYTNLEQDIEEYYKLPLADCTLTDDFSLVIRVLAPIRRSDVYHKLVEITTIPFLEKLTNATGLPESLCRLKLPMSKLTLIETSTGLLLDTSCEPNQLCKTSEISTVFENDACTSAILSDSQELITNTCKFSCFTVNPIALPLIRRVASDTYIVVGSDDIKIHLNCFDRPKELIPIRLKNVGALRIKLACNCQILYSTHVSYRPREPCSGKTSVTHLMPYHWYNKALNRTLDKEDKEFERALEKEEKEFGSRDTPAQNDTIEGDDGDPKDDTEPVTNIEDEQIESSVTKQEEELENKFKHPKPEKQLHEVITSTQVQGMSAGLILQLCLLWVLVIGLGATTLYLGYQVHKLMRWRDLQSYKETRILYSVPQTPPEDNNKIKLGAASGRTRVAWDAFYDLFTVH